MHARFGNNNPTDPSCPRLGKRFMVFKDALAMDDPNQAYQLNMSDIDTIDVDMIVGNDQNGGDEPDVKHKVLENLYILVVDVNCNVVCNRTPLVCYYSFSIQLIADTLQENGLNDWPYGSSFGK